jgi:outer membrane protein assembly factor BamA
VTYGATVQRAFAAANQMQEEHGISATLTRRINKNLRASLRYGYYNYNDDSAAGLRDYDAHVVYTSLQYRF